MREFTLRSHFTPGPHPTSVQSRRGYTHLFAQLRVPTQCVDQACKFGKRCCYPTLASGRGKGNWQLAPKGGYFIGCPRSRDACRVNEEIEDKSQALISLHSLATQGLLVFRSIQRFRPLTIFVLHYILDAHYTF